MTRYFLEVAYKGTAYSGFQKQLNGTTIQGELEKCFQIFQRSPIELTGSSRTDAGVHALQNYFHFDYAEPLHPQFVYKMNAILPADIVVKNVRMVSPEAHCRFDAKGRTYRYHIYRRKNPFLKDTAYYFPYTVDQGKLREAAEIIKRFNDFTSFAKYRTQVKTFECQILESEWTFDGDCYNYKVSANRFLRGMVKGLTGTMLQIARGKWELSDLERIILAKSNSGADFSVPSHGLFLESVTLPDSIFNY